MIQTAIDYQRQQKRIADRAAVEAAGLWALMGEEFDASWNRIAPAVNDVAVRGQTAAVAPARDYVDKALVDLSIPPDRYATVSQNPLVGVASSGKELLPVLYGAVIAAKRSMLRVNDTATALKTGGRRLQAIMKLQVADAGRMATSLDIVSRKHVAGMVRVVVPPACDRCMILAGRYYRWSQGFRRHPQCDCTMVPARESDADDLTTDPYKLFTSMSEEEQNRRFGAANAQAIRDGADIFQVVNSRSELYTASGGAKATRYGITRRANWGYQQTRYVKRGRYRQAVKVRLMPEEIYRQAGGNKEEALRLLKDYGFLFDQGQHAAGVVAFGR